MEKIKLTSTQQEKIFTLNDNFRYKNKSYRYLIGTKEGNTFQAKQSDRKGRLIGDVVFFEFENK